MQANEQVGSRPPGKIVNRRAIKIRLKQDVPRYARLTKGIVVDAGPFADYLEPMRLEDFSPSRTGRWCGAGSWFAG